MNIAKYSYVMVDLKRKYFILVFVLLTITESSISSRQCLDLGCICNNTINSIQQVSRRNVTVNCRSKNLLFIPHMELSTWKASKIDLGNNSIHSIGANVFAKQTELKVLLLDRNFIEDVDVASFNVSSTEGSKLISPVEYIDLRGEPRVSCVGAGDAAASSSKFFLANLDKISKIWRKSDSVWAKIKILHLQHSISYALYA